MEQEFSSLEGLKLRIRRSTCFHTLPESPRILVKALDDPNVSVGQIEKIVHRDTLLLSSILRAASSAGSFLVAPPSTLRGAILLLGTKALKSHALVTAINGLDGSQFWRPYAESCARHSLAVAFLAKYLFSRRFLHISIDGQLIDADEIYVAGLLHDIGMPLIAAVEPMAWSRIANLAKRKGVKFSTAFKSIYGIDHSEIAGELLQKWNQAPSLVDAIRYLHRPWECQEKYDALLCLWYADYLANTVFGLSIEPWEVACELPPEFEAEFQLGDDEIELLREALNKMEDAHQLIAA